MSDLSSTATRDRIIDAAMELFGEHGYRGTSITRIEGAAGLSPGAGGIYHHFRSKEAVLTAGIERCLSRLSALRDIRRLFVGIGDLHTELTIAGRYILAELDQEAPLLRLLVSESGHGPTVLTTAATELLDGTYRGFAEWISEHPDSTVSAEQARAITTIGVGTLISHRLLAGLLSTTPSNIDDEVLISTWVSAIEQLIRDGGNATPAQPTAEKTGRQDRG